MTVKAARLVSEADVIITPKTEKKDGSVALNIAKPYIKDHTEIVPVVFPMVLNDDTQKEGWKKRATSLRSCCRKVSRLCS